MFYACFITIVVIFYIFCDFNYLIRTLFTVCCGRIHQKHCCWNDVTIIYGLCTLQDCDIRFRYLRLARLLRELDFARYHYYDRTGIYRRSQQLGIKSLQGSTLTISLEPIHLFTCYKILTKLVFWDERSLYFEHEVVTLHDDRVRAVLVSRQFALGTNKESTAALLEDLPGTNIKPNCPKYITAWLRSMQISSDKLRNM